MRLLSGRSALVTGATGGIGPHIVRALAREGMDLVLSGLPDPQMEVLADEVRKGGGEAVTAPADVTDGPALEALAETAADAFGGIDLLVNNAGIETIGAYHELEPETIHRMVAVNTLAPMQLTRLVLPGMLERGRGHVVFMSSYVGRSGPAFLESYAASKGALIPFTQSLRSSYRKAGVSASVLLPGFVKAGMYRAWEESLGQGAPRFMGRATAEGVAKALVRVVKRDLPEAFVTGNPARIFTTLFEAWPRLGESVWRFTGANEWFRRVAAMQAEVARRTSGEAERTSGRGASVGGTGQ